MKFLLGLSAVATCNALNAQADSHGNGVFSTLETGVLDIVHAINGAPQVEEITGCSNTTGTAACANAIAHTIIRKGKACYDDYPSDENSFDACVANFCAGDCSMPGVGFLQAPKMGSNCKSVCKAEALPLFAKFAARDAPSTTTTTTTAPADPRNAAVDVRTSAPQSRAVLLAEANDAANEEMAAMADLEAVQERMKKLNSKIRSRAELEIRSGDKAKGEAKLAKLQLLDSINSQVESHLQNVQHFRNMVKSPAVAGLPPMSADGGLPPMAALPPLGF